MPLAGCLTRARVLATSGSLIGIAYALGPTAYHIVEVCSMDESNYLVEGTAATLDEQLLPAVDVLGVENETDIEKANGLAFELYKEAASLVNLASHLLDDDAVTNGGWPRNQAICAGLLVRISKFMLVVTQLSADRYRAEVVAALNRSILETAVNLEFLVTTNDGDLFDKFVTLGLGPERELYDTIQANITARGGEELPIERRMLSSIDDVCRMSGVKIEGVERKHKEWAGNVRARLQAIGKGEQYAAMMRIPSHAVHGNWVDLYKNHLEVDRKSGFFSPKSRFSAVDERHLGPIAIVVLGALEPYLLRYFSTIPEIRGLLTRIDGLSDRIIKVGNAHERLLSGD